VLSHPLLDQLDSLLQDVVAGESVQFRGEWATPARRTYKAAEQEGTGSGPWVDVVDSYWRGALTSVGPVSGIAFMVTARDLYWAKAPMISLTLPVDVSFHAYAGYEPAAATFTASIAGAGLPGVPVPGIADPAGACTLGPDVLTTGRVACLARVSTAAFFVLLLQRDLLKVGRKRLWRVRDDITSSLPEGTRELLTHRRTGFVRSGPP
jgi:hypothetical protein